MKCDKDTFIKKIWMNNDFIHIEGLGRIGMYSNYDKAILLDYSLKFMGYCNESIPCDRYEIKEKIYKLFNMKTIDTFFGTEPILEIRYDEQQKEHFGIHRDRNPDAGWGEFRSGRMDERVKKVELTEELKKILIEDICACYGGKSYDKLKEFDLLK